MEPYRMLKIKQNRTTKKSWVEGDLSKSLKKWNRIEERQTDRQRDRQTETERQTQRDRDRQTETDRESNCWIFVNQVVFLTVNHRGHLRLRELHSTDETIVWRDPGGSWACLPPVYHHMWNHWIKVGFTCHYTGISSMHSQKREKCYGVLERTEQQRRKAP